jgi:hypothetical protein
MNDEIRRLERKYILSNYPYADSALNQRRLRQLGALFSAAPKTPAPPPPPPEPEPEPEPKTDYKKIIVYGILVYIVYKYILN